MRTAASLFDPQSGTGDPEQAVQPGGEDQAGSGQRSRSPIPGSESAKAVGGPERLTVSQLAARIGAALKGGLPARVAVIGEVSGLKDQTHWYFRLKDAGAVIDCVLFASAARRAGPPPRDGDEVLAIGRVEHFARQGRTQLYVDRIEPIGAGALEQKFRELCESVRSRGWFDIESKRPLPRFPHCVAVVTSKTGAALQDVLDTFRRRAPFIPILLVDVRVQGERAALQIAAAIDRLNQTPAIAVGGMGDSPVTVEVDAILLTRGGGSIEDLWAFNELPVAEAIHRSIIPIVAAIGHESDTTIAELVADVRAATPTQAAMRLSPDREALMEQLDLLSSRLGRSISQRAAHERQRVHAALRHAILSDPAAMIRERRTLTSTLEKSLESALRLRLHRDRLRLAEAAGALATCRPEAILADRAVRTNELSRRLDRSVASLLALRRTRLAEFPLRLRSAMMTRLDRGRSSLRECERTLEATGPMNVLRRGYTVTTRVDGRVARSPSELLDGDIITTRFAEGEIVSTVGDHAAHSPPQPFPEADDGLFLDD